MRILLISAAALVFCSAATAQVGHKQTGKDRSAADFDGLANFVPARDGARACFTLQTKGFSLKTRLGSETMRTKRTMRSASFMFRVKSRDDPDRKNELLHLFYMEAYFDGIDSRFLVEGYCVNRDKTSSGRRSDTVECLVECDGGSMRVWGGKSKLNASWSLGHSMRLKSCNADTPEITVGPTGSGEALRFTPALTGKCMPMEKFFKALADKID